MADHRDAPILSNILARDNLEAAFSDFSLTFNGQALPAVQAGVEEAWVFSIGSRSPDTALATTESAIAGRRELDGIDYLFKHDIGREHAQVLGTISRDLRDDLGINIDLYILSAIPNETGEQTDVCWVVTGGSDGSSPVDLHIEIGMPRSSDFVV